MARIPAAPPPRIRTKTEIAIDEAIAADGGNRYRALLEKWLPTVKDAYRQDDGGFRSHLGASLIGRECARELWYGWRWAFTRKFPPRILRLFNRGHREEASFLAMLEMIGVHIHDPGGDGQERISDHAGHFGSALDGVLYNIPDLPNEWCLGEFKTHGTKPFTNLLNGGGGVAKQFPSHYAQMQTCMARRGIHKCLYMAVNKNDDDLYCEIVLYHDPVAKGYLAKAGDIIYAPVPPAKISEDPSFFKCTTCDAKQVCHYRAAVEINCRTCRHAIPETFGGWACGRHEMTLDKERQLEGCDDHEPIEGLTI